MTTNIEYVHQRLNQMLADLDTLRALSYRYPSRDYGRSDLDNLIKHIEENLKFWGIDVVMSRLKEFPPVSGGFPQNTNNQADNPKSS